MNKGTVKFFNESKGFGFITEEGTNKEHFVHVSGLIDEIRENDEVEFDLQDGRKGLNAGKSSCIRIRRGVQALDSGKVSNKCQGL